MGLALFGCDVTITDVPAVMYLLEENVQRNLPPAVLQKTKGKVRIKSHRWGESVSELEGPYDVIIGTDVVYREDIIDPLIQSIKNLSDHDTTVIIANEIRSKRILDLFFQRMTVDFKYQTLSLKSVDDLFETSAYQAFVFKKKK